MMMMMMLSLCATGSFDLPFTFMEELEKLKILVVLQLADRIKLSLRNELGANASA